MARPKKEGLQYYPTDTNIYFNQKIINLSNRFGSFGSDIYNRILASIYLKNGYYMEFDINSFDYFLGQTKCDEDKFFEILNFMNSRNYFIIRSLSEDYKESKELNFNSLPLLITGESVQEQYKETIKVMKRKPLIYTNFWVLEIDESDSQFEFTESQEYEDIILPELDVYEKNKNFLKSVNYFQNIPNKPEVTKNKQEKTNKDSELTPVSFNNKKEREREKEKENKSINTKGQTVETNNEGNKPVEESKQKTKKKTRYSQKDKPENNYGEAVSKLNEKNAYGEFENVYLTDKELQKLKDEFPSTFSQCVETLSSYKAQQEKGYKSDYAAIRNWVVKRVDEDNKINQRNKGGSRNKVSPERIKAVEDYENSIFENLQKKLEATV